MLQRSPGVLVEQGMVDAKLALVELVLDVHQRKWTKIEPVLVNEPLLFCLTFVGSQ